MCLIIASPGGAPVSEDVIIRGFADNPQGWGVMYAMDNNIEAVQGLDFGEYLVACAEAINSKCPYVIHTRWATIGEINTENCHPFCVQRDLYMAHNGTVRDIPITDRDMSDSWHLAQLLQQIGYTGENFNDPRYIKCLELIIGTTNKVVLMNNEGRMVLANPILWTLKDGLFYSNTESML